MLQVALWLVLKTADSKKQLALPLSIFGIHLFLGNWWNGEQAGSPKGFLTSILARADLEVWVAAVPAAWQQATSSSCCLLAYAAHSLMLLCAGCACAALVPACSGVLRQAQDGGECQVDGRFLGIDCR